LATEAEPTDTAPAEKDAEAVSEETATEEAPEDKQD